MNYNYQIDTPPITQDAIYSRLFALGFREEYAPKVSSVEEAKKNWGEAYFRESFAKLEIGVKGKLMTAKRPSVVLCCEHLSLDKLFSEDFEKEVERANEPPKPEFRPWKPEEVPVGAITRIKSLQNDKFEILGRGTEGIIIHVGRALEYYGYKWLFENREYSIDGGKTWLPCGVQIN